LLVVDDDSEVVDFLCESLVERGYEVRGSVSAREALELATRETFDLVILDVEMPDMRGTELCAAILRSRPTQLVLVITAFGTIELAVSMVRGGACDFLAKPFKIEALAFAIERAFEDRQMHREIVRLAPDSARLPPTRLVARSTAMRKVIDTAARAARSSSTVLITGETGTGKSALATFIHESSAAHLHPFFHVNCASLPANLVESELFGVKRGAFTDARDDRPGAFVAAGKGTLFLDEIGELPLDVQAKLLHALERGVVRALGASVDTPVFARLVAATNRPLEALLTSGQFRYDLYYRLNVIRIEMPPLRARREDIQPMVDAMLERERARHRRVVGISASALRRLLRYDWPGNVRELSNVLERAAALTEHDTILDDDLQVPDVEMRPAVPFADRAEAPLEDVERAHLLRVLEARGGNKSAAARVLGIDRRTLYRKLRRAGGAS
jgi:DNA-binding NtrC family response regulator